MPQCLVQKGLSEEGMFDWFVIIYLWTIHFNKDMTLERIYNYKLLKEREDQIIQDGN